MSTNIFPTNQATYPDPSGQSSILIEYDLFENLLITIMPLNEAPEVYSLLTFEDDHQQIACFHLQEEEWKYVRHPPLTLLALVEDLGKSAYKPESPFPIDIETAEFIKHLGLESDMDAYNFFLSVKHWQYFDYPKIYMLIVFFYRENLTDELKQQAFTTSTLDKALKKNLSNSKRKNLRKLHENVPAETLLKAAEIIILKRETVEDFIKMDCVNTLINHETAICPLSLIAFVELYEQYEIVEALSWIKLGVYTKETFQQTHRLLWETFELAELLGKEQCFWSFCYSLKSEEDIIKRNKKWTKKVKGIDRELPPQAFQKFPDTELNDNELFKHISDSRILKKTGRLLKNCAFDLRIQCTFHTIELFQYLAANGKCIGLLEISIFQDNQKNTKRYELGNFLGYENCAMSELDKVKLEQWINFQTVIINKLL